MSELNDAAPPALTMKRIERTYLQGGRPVPVLRGAELSVAAGEVVALVGPSGSGKSTLLHVAGLLEHPDRGEVWIGKTACGKLNDVTRTTMRRQALGFVYQFHHLMPEFTAIENVMLPRMIAGVRRSDARLRAQDLLGRVGLAARTGHRPGQLSGGEQQRVAIARALANNPRVLLADEPTGNLDPETSEHVIAELLNVVRQDGLAALIATHNFDIANRMDRVLTLRDGALV